MERHTNKPTGRRGGASGQEDTEKKHSDLHELFLDEIADIYNAEQQLIKALPKMVKAAQSEELREAIQEHLEETQEQVSRLEQAAEELEITIKRKTCKAMEGLIKEAQEILEEQKNSKALDAAIIAAAQKVEHYEIATYGTLCAWAEQMGHTEVADLLGETQDEEESADERLTAIAEAIANQSAESE